MSFHSAPIKIGGERFLSLNVFLRPVSEKNMLQVKTGNFFQVRLCQVMLELPPATFDIYREMQKADMVKVDKDAKRRPGEIDSILHWAGKTHSLM